MKKIVIIFVGVLIIILICLYNFRGQEKMNVIQLSKTSSIYNKSSIVSIDTILYVGLDILDIRDIIVIIRDLDDSKKIDNETTLRAYIKNGGNQYILYMADMGDREAIKVLSHELVHIKQYYDGSLKDIGDKVIWKGDTIIKSELGGINYFERGWEVEAFSKQDSIDRLITKKLYK